MDNLSKKARSALMAKIKGKNTCPEMIVRKFLFSKGFRYRIHDSRYPGSPDIVLPKYHTMIFVHGCFWHGHENCRASRLPTTNVVYWQNKNLQNVERDRKKIESLEKDGWKVIVIWECKIKTKQQRNIELETVVNKILDRAR
jgi:DNA mismatch endonuclease (patch repair protein)